MTITNLTNNPFGFSAYRAEPARSNPKGFFPSLADTSRWRLPFHEDFDQTIDTTASTGVYVHTATNGTLAQTLSTITQTLAGADNDASQVQMRTANFSLVAGKKFLFEWRGKHAQGATGTQGQEEILIGVGSVQTAANLTVADGTTLTVDDFIGFWKGATPTTQTLSCVARASDAQVGDGTTTYVNDTYTTLTMYYDGAELVFYKDGSYISSISSGLPTAALAPVLFVKAEEAKGKILTTDYITIVSER